MPELYHIHHAPMNTPFKTRCMPFKTRRGVSDGQGDLPALLALTWPFSREF